MRGFVRKAVHTVRTEGAQSFAVRTIRYLAYRWKRVTIGRSEREAAVRAMAPLRNRFRGRRAFLIGNGPSLNQTPLYLLNCEQTICFNRWDLMLERLDWYPSFYTVIDDRVLEDTIDVVNELTKICEYAFLPDIHPYNIDYRDKIVKRDNVYWLHLDSATFSINLPQCGINKTVANVGIQILAFLGFSEIYLLGLDMTYTIPAGAKISGARDIESVEDNDESHFDPRYFGRGRKFHVPMLNETFEKFREAKQFCEGLGVTVINCTVGGALEVFPRATLEDVLGLDTEEIERRFLASVRGKILDPEFSVEDALLQPLSEPANVPLTADSFVVPADQAGGVIQRHVFSFVPFGPFRERCLFVRRDLVKPSSVPA